LSLKKQISVSEASFILLMIGVSMVRIDAEFVMSIVRGVTALRDPPPLGASSTKP